MGWLIGVALAAVLINTRLLYVLIDFISIFTSSTTYRLNSDSPLTPNMIAYLIGRYNVITYANTAIVISLLVLTIRYFQEKNNAKN